MRIPALLLPLDFQFEKMRGAGNARIVVADGLLALAGELGVVEAEPGLREGAQVGLDGRLVLGGRG